MNREIKFRAWDGKEIIACGSDATLENDNWKIMQFTGLKDKNGKEIYQGDQVKTPAGIGEVKWDKCDKIFWNEIDCTTLYDTPGELLEVVGNIFESPTLLSTKQK